MFANDQSFPVHRLKREQLASIAISSNQTMASTGQTISSARAYLVTYTIKDKVSVFAYLFFPELLLGQVFRPDSFAVEPERIAEMEQEGVEFLESIGFIMEPVAMASMERQAQDRFLATLPFLYPSLAEYAKQQADSRAADYLLQPGTGQRPLVQPSRPAAEQPLLVEAEVIPRGPVASELAEPSAAAELREQLGRLLVSF